jgi:hypothetical protein
MNNEMPNDNDDEGVIIILIIILIIIPTKTTKTTTREIGIDKCICKRSDAEMYEHNVGLTFPMLIALNIPKKKEVKLSL